jgi:hypothetical protein
VIDPARVSAVLVTRGDVPMTEIIDSLEQAGVQDIVVWNNADHEHDLKCYGRYAGIAEARNEFILFQDDDLTVPVADLLRAFDPVTDRFTVVANNRIDEEWPLIGIGSIFHRDLADCFTDYIARYGMDDDFLRGCDVVFAYQHPYRRVVLGYQDLPWHSAPNSMYLTDDHMTVRFRVRARTFELALVAA